jgi:hypothetical protein
MCLIWLFFFLNWKLVFELYMARCLVKNEHQKDKVLMRLREWTMCPKNMDNARFNSEHHNLQGLSNYLKRKIFFEFGFL